MDTRRQKKIASLLKETFSEILQQEGRRFFEAGALVSITQVKITPDNSIVRFYLSIFNAKNPDEIMKTMNDRNWEFRRMLGKKLRNHLRKLPDIEFYRDDTMEEVDRIEELFKQIKEKDED